jgi:DNA-binding NarL/FixJ family response regulator
MRVIVADDSVIVREGVRRLLEAEDHEVVDLVGDALAIPAAVAHGQPDAVVLDLRMPPTFTDEGLRAALSLRAAAPDLGVLLLSQHAVPEYATLLLAGGARATGYLLKDRILAPRQLSETLGILAAGGTVVDPDVVAALLAVRRRDDPPRSTCGGHSRRSGPTTMPATAEADRRPAPAQRETPRMSTAGCRRIPAGRVFVTCSLPTT